MVLDLRLKKLKLEIKSQEFDAVLISSVSNIVYLTGYSGFFLEEREAYLLITPSKQFIFTDGRYSEAARNLVSSFELAEISSKNKFSILLSELINQLKIKKLGIEENNLRVSEYKSIKKVISSTKDFKFHGHRAIKTPEEIGLIESACNIGDQAFKFIIDKIKFGISEIELSYLLENFIREKGFEPSFKTIVAFGANSAVPHHLSGDSKLKKGDFVLLDFGVKFKNYCSDMTRTLVFGKASDEQKKIHRIVKEAQQKAFEYLQKNHGKKIKCADTDNIARDWIIKNKYPSIPHSLGHGIGIEVHEHPFLSPNSKETLGQGRVFSIEPGIYINGFGGVRIEDLFVIEKNGPRQLTASQKDLIEVK